MYHSASQISYSKNASRIFFSKTQSVLAYCLVTSTFFVFNLTSCAQDKESDSAKIRERIIIENAALSYLYGSQQHALDSAIIMWDKAIALDSTRAVLHQLKSETNLRMGNPREAVNTLNNWLNKHPEDIDLTLKRGLILHRLNLDIEASKDFAVVRKYLLKNPATITDFKDKKSLALAIDQIEKFVLIGENENALKIMKQIQRILPEDKNRSHMPALPTQQYREELIKSKIGI